MVLIAYNVSCFPAELGDPTLIIDPITEERASRTLYRIELLRRIREQVLPHPELEERLRLCQPSPDLPAWWEPGKHDRDLLLGAAKHGVSRTDYHIQNDPELSFRQAQHKFTQNRGSETVLTSNPQATMDLIKDEELKDEQKYDTAEKADIDEVKEEKTNATSPKQEVKAEAEEKNELEGKMEKENEAEVKSEENLSISLITEDEEVTKTESTLPVPADNDTNKGEQENPTNTENHKPSTEKTSEGEEEEEDEKMDEDDKSEKSSQAEGKMQSNVNDVGNLFIQII